MNKVFSLFMICAMAVSLTAADTLNFNRYQFQPALGEFNEVTYTNYVANLPAITVPFVYSGNLKLTGYGAADNDWINYEYADDDCFVGKNSVNLPIYMTICQPCLDCYPCAVLGQEDGIRMLDSELKVGKDAAGNKALVGSVTRWNLYVVEKWKDDDKKDNVTVYKVNLMTTQNDVDSVFFTGRKGSGNDSYAFAQYRKIAGDTTTQFAMIGKKNDYKFKYQFAKLQANGTWTAPYKDANGKVVTDTAYIKSASKFDGVFCVAKMYGRFIETPVAYWQLFNPADTVAAKAARYTWTSWKVNNKGEYLDAEDKVTTDPAKYVSTELSTLPPELTEYLAAHKFDNYNKGYEVVIGNPALGNVTAKYTTDTQKILRDTVITPRDQKFYGFQYCGEIKLTRNASLTNMAIQGAFGVTKPKAVSNWEDCDEEIPATYCEEYFLAEFGDKMDTYLKDKVYKSYGKRYHDGAIDFVDEYLADFWEDAVDPMKKK